jgi:tRNA pseudouridine55 synthase
VIQFGLRTSTDDMEGEVLERSPVPPLRVEDIEALLAPFRGVIQQRPPSVSAVHVGGQRAYRLAQRGEFVSLPSRSVTIHRLEAIGWDAAGARLELAVHGSAGTYVRALARDLGDALGCGGTLARLQRTAALGFELSQAIQLERVVAARPPLLDPLSALRHLPHRQLDEAELIGWRCGRSLPCPGPWEPDQTVVIVTPDGNLAGIARANGEGILRPRLVLDASG